jgi:protein-S-isoprenylcysteine O-methyltransferase Ste14
MQPDATVVTPLMRIPPPLVFILMYLVGVAAQRTLPISIRASEASRVIHVAGFVLVGLGILIAFSALGLFRKVSTTIIPFEKPSTLVTSGPYRFSRNPMYVSLTLLYLGVAAISLEIWPIIVLPLVLVYLNFLVIPVEERRLHDVFGDDYQAYGARVRRWL